MYDNLERMETRSLTICILFFPKPHLRDTPVLMGRELRLICGQNCYAPSIQNGRTPPTPWSTISTSV